MHYRWTPCILHTIYIDALNQDVCQVVFKSLLSEQFKTSLKNISAFVFVFRRVLWSKEGWVLSNLTWEMIPPVPSWIMYACMHCRVPCVMRSPVSLPWTYLRANLFILLIFMIWCVVTECSIGRLVIYDEEACTHHYQETTTNTLDVLGHSNRAMLLVGDDIWWKHTWPLTPKGCTGVISSTHPSFPIPRHSRIQELFDHVGFFLVLHYPVCLF